jgi:hypothetical protein
VIFPDDAASIRAAHNLCDYLRAGHSGQEGIALILLANRDQGMTVDQARRYVAVAIEAYCPGAAPVGGA